jgi:diguanylate cyclase (GGDEF)-like protein
MSRESEVSRGSSGNSSDRGNGGPKSKNGAGKESGQPDRDAESEQRLGTDQTLSDSDQTAADDDQSASDADRSQSDRDQRASDRDQAAADRDESGRTGSDETRAHAVSRAEREQGTKERDRASLSRFRIASDRDERATVRDRNSVGRDLAAEGRDRAAEELDREADSIALGPGAPEARLREALTAAEAARKNAAANRAGAAEDRQRAAADRRLSARDRLQANVELERAHLDVLTGAYQRGMGEMALGHEIARAQRADARLVFAFVDVDGLKAVNEAGGHEAGDRLLRSVAVAIQSKLRSYDPIVRVGGDEFACALADADLEDAVIRFDEIQATLETGSFSVGLTEMRADDSVTDLMKRSNDEMRRVRAASR